MTALRATQLAPGILAAEAAACTEAASLCSQSIDAYAKVRGVSGGLREDALVNSGNVLCQWAEYLAVAQPDACSDVDALLVRACSSYDAAAAAAPSDAPADTELLCNWADALVRRAEGLAAVGNVAAAEDVYQRALRTYEAACSGADVSFGDDVSVRVPCCARLVSRCSHTNAGHHLQGMVYNWGCALSSYATHMPGLDAAAKATALLHAATQLKAASDLSAGDVAPLNALGACALVCLISSIRVPYEDLCRLGDVLHEMAEHGIAMGAPSQEVDALLQRALDEGYLLALRVHRGDTDARVGLAEVRLAQARRVAAGGDTAHALEWASASADAYAAALATPGALGSVGERCEVQYNFACAAANCGRLDEARAAIQQLLECGSTSVAEVTADADLAPLR